ncbi:MAG TPA: hypothetical protein VM345_10845 [Acidimicrobiales bacterium]|jgi:hypothetical protein|nr:hypothetical protein [Acidimicrobiales bacterium]
MSVVHGANVRTRAKRLLTHEARRLLLPLAVLTVISTAGTAAAPTLAHDQPLVLMALSPRLAFLTLAANKVALVPFVIIGAIRLCLADPFHFALGRRHGHAAIEKIPGRFGSIARVAQRLAGRSVPLLVFLRPNGTNLAIAGASRSRTLHVALADVVGTLAYLVLIHTAGTAIL